VPRVGPAPLNGGAAVRGGAPRPASAPLARPVAQPAVEADDEPTEVHGEPVHDDDGPSGSPATATEVPGRHRRRAGESPGARPAAEYKAQADAARTGRRPRSGRRRRENFWRELPLLVVVALVLTFLIQTFLAKVYVIPSGSMEETLHGCTGCNNDRVLVDKVTYRFTDPSPGDIVVFRGPDSWSSEVTVERSDNALVNGLQQFGSLIGLAPPDEKDFVKRVIAVGGQTVQCCDSRDRVLVDGEPLDEPYIHLLAGTRNRQDPFDAVTVPEGQLWLMGDSRNNSADSRVPGHGPVPVANVIGQARFIVLPFDRFQWLPSIDPHPPQGVGMGADGVPLALGVLGTLPLAFLRRRRGEDPYRFLP
jgi:signal peptidase I